MLKLIKAGFQSSVQDLGRHGYRHQGIARCGALDGPALTTANYLVGNQENFAGMEIQGGAVSFQLLRDSNIAVCGQGFSIHTNNAQHNETHDLKLNQPARIKQNDIVNIVPRGSGRAYLAIDGGINVAPIMGSRSTDMTSGFGGFSGRALQDGDEIPLGEAGYCAPPASISARSALPGKTVRALIGPEYQQLGSDVTDSFWGNEWRIGSDSNRMGCRLRSSSVNFIRSAHQPELNSHGVIPGTVQLPANGKPIILLADGQTTGGYPRIATIIAADLWRLAQMPHNQIFRFICCTEELAVAAFREQQQQLYRLKIATLSAYNKVASP